MPELELMMSVDEACLICRRPGQDVGSGGGEILCMFTQGGRAPFTVLGRAVAVAHLGSTVPSFGGGGGGGGRMEVGSR